MQWHPPRSVEATESALGLLPSRALSSAQFALIITAASAGCDLCGGNWNMALYLGGKIHVGTNHLAPRRQLDMRSNIKYIGYLALEIADTMWPSRLCRAAVP